MKSIAIITARGGSKRIPRKNIRDFLGKPIISYSIKTALLSGLFDEVMVSTDDVEISKIAIKYGASVPFLRSAVNSNDNATTFDVLEEVINYYENNNRKFDYICCIYPTAPFITTERLCEAHNLLLNVDCESVITVTKYSFPPQRGLHFTDEYVNFLFPSFSNSRSQDLEDLYHDCGQFYYIKREAFYTYKSLITPKTKAIVIPDEECQDIDNESDWAIAEMKYKLLKGIR